MKVNCRMYAFARPLREAWTAVFACAGALLAEDLETDFSAQTADAGLSHTCGYPYILDGYRDSVPVMVPEYSINGCDGINYRSIFLTGADSERARLSDFNGTRCVINDHHSNSGMNVLRHEIIKLGMAGQFFSGVMVSGTHLKSLEYILEGDADLAAIDVVTWHLAAHQGLINMASFRIIGESVKTPGLPFVQRRDAAITAENWASALNTALAETIPQHRDTLPINRFSVVGDEHYNVIRDMENQAVQAGYQTLR